MAQRSRTPEYGWRDLASAFFNRLPFSKLAQGSALSVLGVTGNATADHASIAAGTDGHVLRRSGTALSFGTIAVSALASGTFTEVTTTSTGTQNNFNPGISGNTHIRCNNAGTLLTITGFPAGVAGQMILVSTVNTGQVDLAHNNAGSSAGNKLFNIATSASTSIYGAGNIVAWALYIYDGTSAVWRLVGHEQGSWITPTFAAGNYTANGAMTWTVGAGDVTTQAYLLRGKTLTSAWSLSATDVGGVVNTNLQIGNGAWGGFTSTKLIATMGYGRDNGALGMQLVSVAAAGTIIVVNNATAGNWTASAANTSSNGTISFEVT